MVQDSTDEIEYGDIPYIIKNMCKEGECNYDGVVVKQMAETPSCSVITDVYVAFSPRQVEFVK